MSSSLPKKQWGAPTKWETKIIQVFELLHLPCSCKHPPLLFSCRRGLMDFSVIASGEQREKFTTSENHYSSWRCYKFSSGNVFHFHCFSYQTVVQDRLKCSVCIQAGWHTVVKTHLQIVLYLAYI